MPIINQTHRTWVLLGLVLLMSATRFHHFGSVNFLPDASLAVFFLAGFYLIKSSAPAAKAAKRFLSGNAAVFAVLFVAAVAIDYVAVNFGSVSDWCITPAYLFLLPTYAVMYLAGGWCRRFKEQQFTGALQTAVVLVGSASLAFLVSNVSFYLFSGRFTDMSWLTFGNGVFQYYLSYVGYALLYSAAVLGAHAAIVKIMQSGGIKQAQLH